MRKFVISLSMFFLSALLCIYAFSYMDFFRVRALGTDCFSSTVASIERFVNIADDSNFFSSRFQSLRGNLESLAYVDEVSISSSGFLSFDVSISYEKGLVLSDGRRFYFFSEEGIGEIEYKDVPPLLSRYILFMMTEEMLSYVLSFPESGELDSILALLMDIQGQNGYNENLIGRVGYSLPSGSGFGVLTLYGKEKDFILFITGETDSSFLSSCLEKIDGMDFLDHEVFEIGNDTFFRRLG
ncbi:MAG TPA: hypothetical protein IAA76_09490 [Candidatus Ornithospirochaeta stercorigallinarum]|nr:hypothetical protein [Candidatus Ornithospirochaeta stercorigallinarum]